MLSTSGNYPACFGCHPGRDHDPHQLCSRGFYCGDVLCISVHKTASDIFHKAFACNINERITFANGYRGILSIKICLWAFCQHPSGTPKKQAHLESTVKSFAFTELNLHFSTSFFQAVAGTYESRADDDTVDARRIMANGQRSHLWYRVLNHVMFALWWFSSNSWSGLCCQAASLKHCLVNLY